jgi:hypothetical protein
MLPGQIRVERRSHAVDKTDFFAIGFEELFEMNKMFLRSRALETDPAIRVFVVDCVQHCQIEGIP